MGSVLVLDYPQARTRRLMLALRACAIDARLSESPLQAKNADHLIVPDGDDDDEALARGVGRGVLEALAAHIQKERPTLCIGLGLHFLLEGSAGPESPPGLGVFHAGVQRFDPRMTDEGERPLACPHTGRSLVVGLDRHPTLKTVLAPGQLGAWLAFRHRLCAPSRIPQADVAVCHHGVPFAGAIWRGAVSAIQFLPEHSGRTGLAVLRAWRGQG